MDSRAPAGEDMTRRILMASAALALLAAAFVATRPAAFAIERTERVEAPAAVVYGHIASLRAMDVWSPWVRMDANLKLAYAGPESGVGARSEWEGPEMGRGRLTVTAVNPPDQVEMRLDMLAPMAASNRILFTLAPAGAGTDVTWRMEGRNGFLGKFMTLIVDMDEMIGVPFEQGLAALKDVAEADAREET
jgi:hypothetical protein